MARNTTHVKASPEAVWAVLEDPYAYPQWVVGADRTLEADPAWPAPGSRFKVKLAFGTQDFTEVKEVKATERIVLHAAAVLLGPARVEIRLARAHHGTYVTIIEDPAGKFALLRVLPTVQLAIKIRNIEALRRLRSLCEQRAATA